MQFRQIKFIICYINLINYGNSVIKSDLNTLSDRLLYAIELTQTKKADLARAIGIQPQTIQHLCHGDVQSSRFTFELATVLGLNTRWLATGEGEILLSDDPKNKLFDEYKKIPLLNTEQLILTAKECDPLKLDETKWVVLKSEEQNVFCTHMSDASMLPLLPPNANIFFKKIKSISEIRAKQGSVVIAYLPDFDSVLIREIIVEHKRTYLSPQNKNLFKEIELTKNIIIFGEAIECHFSLSKK